jgi:tetratricopeptide (TPR) repeat protein
MRTGENDKALADFNEAIRLNPKYVFGYKNRAAVYERMGDKDRAANLPGKLDPRAGWE